MKISDLPLGPAPKALTPQWFPTPFQAVIFRNWEMVPPKRLAEVLQELHEVRERTLDGLLLGGETPGRLLAGTGEVFIQLPAAGLESVLAPFGDALQFRSDRVPAAQAQQNRRQQHGDQNFSRQYDPVEHRRVSPFR